MKGVVENLRSRNRIRRKAILLPAFLLPFALMGFTVNPALDAVVGRQELARARELAQRAQRSRELLIGLGTAEEVSQAAELRRQLYRLVPGELPLFEVYSRVRQAAGLTGFEVHSVVGAGEQDLSLIVGNDSIAVREVQVSGSGSLRQALATVAVLRELNLPVAVLGARLQREDQSSPVYSIDLRLGAFHHIPAASGGGEETQTP